MPHNPLMTSTNTDRTDLVATLTAAQERVSAFRAELATCTTDAMRRCVREALEAACWAYHAAISALEAHDESAAESGLSDSAEHVLSAVQMLSERTDRVELTGLRAVLSLARESADSALIELQDAGRLVLYRNDRTASLTAADHEAALYVGGCPRHLVYLTP